MNGLDSSGFDMAAFTACVAPVSSTAFALVDDDGVVQFLNRSATLLLGSPRAEEGVRWTDLCRPADPVALAPDRLAAHGPAGIQTALDLADGTRVPVVVAALRVGTGHVLRIERETSPTTPDLGALLASATRDAVILTDPDGIVTYWNEGATRLYGWTAEERIGRRVTERHPESVRPELDATVDAIRDGHEWDGEFENWHKDGSRVWVDALVRAVTTPDGRFGGILGLSHDITARKQAERALRDSEERLRLALDAADAGVWDWDIVTGRSTWSRQTYVLYGLSPDTPASYAVWAACIDPDDRDAARQAVEDAVAGRIPEFRAEYRVRHADGSTRWLLGLGKVIRADDGTPLRMFGIHVDVTERKRAEDALARNNRVLDLIAEGAPLATTLIEIVHMVESQLPGVMCAIFTIEDGPRLHVAAAPSLPATMIDAIEGSAPDPLNGSTGAAAHSGRTVIVEDVGVHPAWEKYRELARSVGVRSCVSVPILASGNVNGLPHGRVLGIFAIYRTQVGAPEPLALAILSGHDGRGDAAPVKARPFAGAAHLARVAIERHRAEVALRSSEERFRDVLDASPALV